MDGLRQQGIIVNPSEDGGEWKSGICVDRLDGIFALGCVPMVDMSDAHYIVLVEIGVELGRCV